MTKKVKSTLFAALFVLTWTVFLQNPVQAFQATGSTGNSTSISSTQPSLAVNYIIALVGFYPSSGNGHGAGDEVFIGEIRMFAGNFAPSGWAFCQGQLLPISNYTALFSLLGTTYGGDGETTFALPDLRGRAITEAGSGPGLSTHNLGSGFGSEGAALTVGQLAYHGHTLTGGATDPAGSNQSLSNFQPTRTIHTMIATAGNFNDMSAIRMFAGVFEPGFWRFTDGQLLSVLTYSTLFGTIGTTYGGDGTNNFALPDLRGRLPLGAGTGPGLTSRTLGSSFGSETSTMVINQLPSHSHTTAGDATGTIGIGQSINNMQPTLTIRYLIAISGLYPSTLLGDDKPAALDSFIAEIRPFAGSATPSGWAECSGQLVSIASNPALFSLLGTNYGGNGESTFGLPDLRGRTPVGSGSGPGLFSRQLGLLFGNENINLSVSTLASHSHGLLTRLPGSVPDGTNFSTPLTINKNAGDPTLLDLAWAGSCGTATGYSVYEGTLGGTFNTHALVSGTCDQTGASLSAHDPTTVSRYYLISSVDNAIDGEGSLGLTSAGVDRLQAATTCMTTEDLSACPVGCKPGQESSSGFCFGP